MVLSNKKLKQKLRAAKAELIVESELRHKSSVKGIDNSMVLNSKTPDSLRNLLSSEANKLAISKREKRRQRMHSLPQEKADISMNGEIDGHAVGNKEGLLQSAHEEGKKKRKRDNSKAVVDEGQNNTEKSKKKKKPKKKVKLQKVENNPIGREGVEQDRNGGSKEPFVKESDESMNRKNIEVSPKVYVGGIPYYSTEDDIRSYFEGCGSITNIDCMEFPDTGKFRGIAIVTFKTEGAAKRALALDGSDMGGLFLKIQPFRSAGMNKLSNFSPSIMEGYNRIYIGNLSWNITENDVRELFSDCSIASIRFGEDKETKYFKGYAHVDFTDSLSLSMALKLDQQVVCGRPVRISCAVPKKGNTTTPSTGKESKIDSSRENATTTSTENESKLDSSRFTSASADMLEVTEARADMLVVTEASAVSSKIRRRTCYECGERGHISSSCPNKKPE